MDGKWQAWDIYLLIWLREDRTRERPQYQAYAHPIELLRPAYLICDLAHADRPVSFGLCEITAMRFELIPYDTDEYSFETKYIILITNIHVFRNHPTANSSLVFHKLFYLEYSKAVAFGLCFRPVSIDANQCTCH